MMKGINLIISRNITLDEIISFTKKRFDYVAVVNMTIDGKNFHRVVLNYKHRRRFLDTVFGNEGIREYGIDGVLLSINTWGESIELMKKYAEHFNGYIIDEHQFVETNQLILN